MKYIIISLLALSFIGCSKAALHLEQSSKLSEDEESICRILIEDLYPTNKNNDIKSVLFVVIFGKSPDNSLLNSIKTNSILKPGHLAMEDRYNSIIDHENKNCLSELFNIKSIIKLDCNLLTVEVEIYHDPVGSASFEYTLEKINGKWIVKSKKMTRISNMPPNKSFKLTRGANAPLAA